MRIKEILSIKAKFIDGLLHGEYLEYSPHETLDVKTVYNMGKNHVTTFLLKNTVTHNLGNA